LQTAVWARLSQVPIDLLESIVSSAISLGGSGFLAAFCGVANEGQHGEIAAFVSRKLPAFPRLWKETWTGLPKLGARGFDFRWFRDIEARAASEFVQLGIAAVRSCQTQGGFEILTELFRLRPDLGLPILEFMAGSVDSGRLDAVPFILSLA
jgi:hypothetical protein